MNYGRGHCEMFLGDLKSLEGLTRAILEGSSASSKMLFKSRIFSGASSTISIEFITIPFVVLGLTVI